MTAAQGSTQVTTVSAFGLAFWALLIIKLCGFAEISWWMVLLPMLIPLGIFTLLIAVCFLWAAYEAFFKR